MDSKENWRDSFVAEFLRGFCKLIDENTKLYDDHMLTRLVSHSRKPCNVNVCTLTETHSLGSNVVNRMIRGETEVFSQPSRTKYALLHLISCLTSTRSASGDEEKKKRDGYSNHRRNKFVKIFRKVADMLKSSEEHEKECINLINFYDTLDLEVYRYLLQVGCLKLMEQFTLFEVASNVAVPNSVHTILEEDEESILLLDDKSVVEPVAVATAPQIEEEEVRIPPIVEESVVDPSPKLPPSYNESISRENRELVEGIREACKSLAAIKLNTSLSSILKDSDRQCSSIEGDISSDDSEKYSRKKSKRVINNTGKIVHNKTVYVVTKQLM